MKYLAITDRSLKTKMGRTLTGIVGAGFIFIISEKLLHSFLSILPMRTSLFVSSEGHLYENSPMHSSQDTLVRYIITEDGEIIWERHTRITTTACITDAIDLPF